MKRIFAALIIIISAILLCATIASAGTGYSLWCENKNCNYKDSIGFGGGFSFNEITGYCVNCKKFVHLAWSNRGPVLNEGKLPEKAPVPVGHVWLPKNSKIRAIYKCPECGMPFMEIKSTWELKYCPRCNKPTLKIKEDILYD